MTQPFNAPTQLYVFKNSQQLGPFSLEEVRAKEKEGEFLSSDLARLENEQSWQTLESFIRVPTAQPVGADAKNIFVRRGENAFGPYSANEVNRYLKSGEIRHSDEARTGDNPEWQPVWQLLGIAPPPPGPSVGVSPTLTSPIRPIARSTHIPTSYGVWLTFAITSVLGTILTILGYGLSVRPNNRSTFQEQLDYIERTESGYPDVLLALGMLITLVSVAAFCVLLYRFWAAIEPQQNRLRPGQAVGFLFIPIYNFYWQFVAVRGLAIEINHTLRSRGSLANPVNVGLATTLCILFCGVWIPGIGFLITLAWCVCAIILLKQMLQACESLS